MECFLRYLLIFVSISVLDATYLCGYTFSNESQAWLKLHEQEATLDSAITKCRSEGAQLAAPYNEAVKLAMLEKMHQSLGAVHTGLPVISDNAVINEKEIWVLLNTGDLKMVERSESHPYFCVRSDMNVTENECGPIGNGYELNSRTGQCYKLHRICANWDQARESCQGEGGHLAVVNSDTEAEELQRLFFRNPPNMFTTEFKYAAFIGFKKEPNKEWFTIFNQSLKEAGYDRWSPYEPNNAHHDEYCGSFGRDGLLFDDPCARSMPYFCERDPVTPKCD